MMFTKKREHLVADYLRRKKSATVSELAKQFDVSEVTIRKDLNQLEKENLIERSFGGAIWIGHSLNEEVSSEIKLTTQIEEKIRISEKAKEIINDGETLFLDAGSTNNILVDSLSIFNNLTILTTDMMIALKLLNETNFKVILIGGEMSKISKSAKDYTAVEMLKRYNVDKAFIGCDSFSEKSGAFTTSTEKAIIKATAMSVANQVILLSTSDKFYKRSLVRFAQLEDFDQLYLSEPFKDVHKLSELNVEITVC